jgi:predicted dehydrogenase
MVNAGCHFVDLLRWLVNEEIIEVFAAANNLAFPEYPESDINVATLRFRSGILGKVLVTFGSGCPQDHSVRVYGSKGCIDNSALFLRQGRGVRWARTIHKPMLYQTRLAKPRSWVGQMLWASGILRHHRPCIQNLRAFAVATLVERLRRALPPGGEYGIRHYPIRLYEHSFACQQAIANFLDAIRGSKKPMCSIDEGARTVLACLAAVESYRTNRPVSVPSLDSIL